MKSGSCVHYAVDRYTGTDNMHADQTQCNAWMGVVPCVHVDTALIEPIDPSLDQKKSLGYLLRNSLHSSKKHGTNLTS